MTRTNIHATGLVLGETGLVLRGPSGSGKSLLTLSLMDAWEARRKAAMLVSDDRLDIERVGDGLVMHAPRAIAGLIELRGRGIVQRPHRAKAPIHLVVDFVPGLERMVEEDELTTDLEGVTLQRCPVPKLGVTDLAHQQLLVLEALRALSPAKPRRGKKTA